MLLLSDTAAEGGLAVEQYLSALDVIVPDAQIAGALIIGSPSSPQLLYSTPRGRGVPQNAEDMAAVVTNDGWTERGGVGLEFCGDTVLEVISSPGVFPLYGTYNPMRTPYKVTSTGGHSNAVRC